LFGKDLTASFSQEGCAGLEKPLHFNSGNGFFNEKKDVRAARFAAANDHGKVEASDLLYESGVVQWILVNVNTAPDASVIRPDRDNSQTRFNALEVLDP
jgi:hypothetical protein